MLNSVESAASRGVSYDEKGVQVVLPETLHPICYVWIAGILIRIQFTDKMSTGFKTPFTENRKATCKA